MPFAQLRTELISDFRDKDDLVETLLTSCHVPFYFDRFPARLYRSASPRHGLYADGGLLDFIPVPPLRDPQATWRNPLQIRVSCFPLQMTKLMASKGLGGGGRVALDEALLICPSNEVKWGSLLHKAVLPCDEAAIHLLFQQGTPFAPPPPSRLVAHSGVQLPCFC